MEAGDPTGTILVSCGPDRRRVRLFWRAGDATHARDARQEWLTTRVVLIALLASPLLSGCVAVVAGTAGGLIVDEGMVENDGRFDPFENTEIVRKIYE